MVWAVRGLIAAVVLVLVCAAATAGWVYAAHLGHPRDEAAFVAAAHQGPSSARCGNAKRCPTTVPLAAVDDDVLLAEGERACEWLADQPYPWWRRGREWGRPGLIERYRADHPATDPVWHRGLIRPSHRVTVIAAAWLHLCGADLVLRLPRNPFNKPASD